MVEGKLSINQMKLLQLMYNGRSLGQSVSSLTRHSKPFLQKGKLGCGGEVIHGMNRWTIFSLSELKGGHGYIKYLYSFPTSSWILTESGYKFMQGLEKLNKGGK